MTYNRFIQGLRLAGVEVDRKILADLAVNDADGLRRARQGGQASRVPRSAPAAKRRVQLGRLISDTNARLATARKLTRRQARRETGRFLAEGAQAVREALRRPEGRRADLRDDRGARAQRRTRRRRRARPERRVDEISARAAAGLSETVTPQGLVAVCRKVDVPLRKALAGEHGEPRLVVVLVDANDPGNAGTILRTADAAGARGGHPRRRQRRHLQRQGGARHGRQPVPPRRRRRCPDCRRDRSGRARAGLRRVRRHRTRAATISSVSPPMRLPHRPPGCSATRRGACRRRRSGPLTGRSRYRSTAPPRA